jgi:malate dehydrogenase (oxaloacetate-decarboxylating)
VISGAGAAGVACARILLAAGATDVTVLLDSRGVVLPGRSGGTGEKAALAAVTNPRRRSPAGSPRRWPVRRRVRRACPARALPEELLAR